MIVNYTWLLTGTLRLRHSDIIPDRHKPSICWSFSPFSVQNSPIKQKCYDPLWNLHVPSKGHNPYVGDFYCNTFVSLEWFFFFFNNSTLPSYPWSRIDVWIWGSGLQFYLLYIYSQSWVVWVVCISTRTFSFINTYIYPSVDRFTFRDVREWERDLLTLTDDVGFTRVFIRKWKKTSGWK